MNRIVLVGRLTNDPEKKIFDDSENILTKFFLAVQRDFKKEDPQENVDFIPITVWGKRAEFAADHLRKGTLVSVSGRLRTKTYEDAEGRRRHIFEVIGDQVTIIGKKKTLENSEEAI